MKPLPSERFEQYSWKKAKIHIDYHVEVDGAYYIAPYRLIGESVDIKYNSRVVQVLHSSKCAASHPRVFKKGHYVTSEAHMPPNHKYYTSAWSPERIRRWAADAAGVYTSGAINTLIESKTYPEQAYRSCIGIIQLSKYYSSEKLEKACRMALENGAVRYKSIKSILEKGLDKVHYLEPETRKNIVHENIRGNNYYRMKGE